ncbi:hypothetical protein [Megasphaera sp. DISK 18]|uniref:hypothetical protein n=1 Tax=Megasphaera sp. DISK 18 TaxID=1776081 RepID=UPI000806F533|nr:hypothetical protein [Megasphaera sp. DISK 18]OBZ32372.1 hypothetical protein A0U42_10965 [Megasphaera sp. DISK 18]
METESWKDLVDVGCSPDCIEQYKRLTDDEQRFLYLRQYRRYLLSKIHDKQQQLDRLDYLLHQLKKGG